jgi:hypothetical protein
MIEYIKYLEIRIQSARCKTQGKLANLTKSGQFTSVLYICTFRLECNFYKLAVNVKLSTVEHNEVDI